METERNYKEDIEHYYQREEDGEGRGAFFPL
jgi:hypothetical protein